jgi:hypothetical protein
MINKTTKTIITALIAIVVIGAIYLLLFKKPELDIEQGETTTTTTTTTITTSTSTSTTISTSTTASIDCKADSNCLSTNFLSCNPLDFKMEFVEPGSQFIITVIGKEGDKCHYLKQVINPDGSILMNYECKVPLTEISLDTVKHFFGQDTGAVKVKQTQSEKAYCVSLQ